MPEPIDKLFVSIGADIADLLRETKEGLAQVEKELGTMEKKGKRAFDETGKSAKGLNATFGKLQKAAGAFIALFAVGKVAGFFVNLGKAMVGANAEFETFTTQFETLLGSAAAAEQRLDELAKFGIETPFELPQVVEASRVLEVFGGAALSTGDNLRMVGDIAAGVNRPFEEVALWTGRMFDAMQSGRPFGEASARLQEMGALSGQARAELEELQKTGASGAELWERFNELVGSKFAGNMERLSGTFQGMTSNLVDFRDNLLRIGGEPLFDEARDSAKQLLDIISEDEMQEALNSLARALGEAAAMATELVTSGVFDSLQDIDPETIQNLADALEGAAAAISEFLDQDVSADVNGLIEVLTLLIDTTTSIVNIFNRAKSALEPIGPVVTALRDIFLKLVAPVFNLIDAFRQLNSIVEQITGQGLVDFGRDVAEASETETQAADKLNETLKELHQVRKSQGAAMREMAAGSKEVVEGLEAEADAARDALDGLAEDFIDAAEGRQEKLENLEAEHGQRMADISAEFAGRRVDAQQQAEQELADLAQETARQRADIIKRANEDLAKLEQDTARQRADIISRAREQLAKLEQETDRRLEDEREDFQADELRATEDHLKEMRALRMRFIDGLEDAVKNRDARAIVDLRKNFNREKQERETDFADRQQREREDQDQRLQEIREEEERRAQEIMDARERDLQNLAENEARKREEIEAARASDLQSLAENEARKRAEIEQGLAQELAKLDEAEAAKLESEQAAFEERQAELEASLQKRLESLAKELADEEDINREGAEAVLKALDETFGIGGDIDKLMEDFANRRRQKFRVEVAFEEVLSGAPRPGAAPAGGGGGGAVGGPAAVPPAFQHGGAVIARRPTLAQFGEVPELATFIPLAKLQMEQSASSQQTKRVEVDLNLRGSAPPGIRSADRDAIAGTMVQALREAGVMK